MSGNRPHLVVFERQSGVADAYGEVSEGWSEICRAYAGVYYGQGSERRQAAMEQAQQPASFEVLGNALTRSLTPSDRVRFADATWDIEGVALDTPRRGLVAITAVRNA